MRAKNRVFINNILSEDKLTIKYSLKLPLRIKKFFYSSTFFVKYDEDITTVPESIRIIPLLLNIAPIAWVNKCDISVQEIDKNFFNSLKKLKQAFMLIYPEIDWEGRIIPDKIVDNKDEGYTNKNRSALLFTGGIDSTTSFYRHFYEKPLLINVRGTNVHLNKYNKIKIVEDELINFANFHNVNIKFIESNLRSFINNSLINTYFEEKLLNFGWWAGIQHGPGLIGLCAPLIFKRKIERIYIASSYTKDFIKKWGSSPLIDNKVKFFFTSVRHDGYKFSRQDKIEYLSNCLSGKNYNFKLNVCVSERRELNCSICEKCSRTIIGLLIAGMNPDKIGFNTKKFSFINVIEKFGKGIFKVTDDELFMWEDIKNHLKSNKKNIAGNIIPGYFLNWLENTSFYEYGENYKRRKKRYRIIKNKTKYFPQLYNIIYKFYLRCIKKMEN